MTGSKAKAKPATRAIELLRSHGAVSVPVNVGHIAQSEGITVKTVPLDNELSGMIFMKDGLPVIVVNSTHPKNRQRFTLAHELGHFVLHMKDIGSRVHVDKKYVMARDSASSKGFDLKEIEANRFAAELLVPRALLGKELRGRVVDVEDEVLVADLARQFQVSRQMMAIRIGELVADLG